MGATFITVQLYVHATSKPRPPPAKPHVEEAQKKDPKPEGDPKTTGTSPPIPPEPPKEEKETCGEKHPKLIRCEDPKISGYRFRSEDAAFNEIVKRLGNGVRKSAARDDAQRGPCIGRGGFHTNVLWGGGSAASIVGCNCCGDSSSKAVQKQRADIVYKR